MTLEEGQGLQAGDHPQGLWVRHRGVHPCHPSAIQAEAGGLLQISGCIAKAQTVRVQKYNCHSQISVVSPEPVCTLPAPVLSMPPTLQHSHTPP